jgi:two-component system, NarL family, nitrate/nitrite response regulator NarL
VQANERAAVRVAVASDIRLYREGLCMSLAKASSLEVGGAAATPEGCIALVRELRPDVVLVDVTMGGSRRTIERLSGPELGAAVVALGVSESPEDIVGWAETGITAFVTRAASLADLIGVLEGAARGEATCSPRVAAMLIRHVGALSSSQSASAGLDTRLTRREHEVLDLLQEGLSNKAIASHLSIEVATVKNHVHNLLEKLGLSHRAEAAAWSRRRRVLDPVD